MIKNSIDINIESFKEVTKTALITGIYKCYDEEKHTLYSGKGNLISRVKEHLVKWWERARDYYSVIKDNDEMHKYESYHLEQYKKENGAYPPQNIIGGKR